MTEATIALGQLIRASNQNGPGAIEFQVTEVVHGTKITGNCGGIEISINTQDLDWDLQLLEDAPAPQDKLDATSPELGWIHFKDDRDPVLAFWIADEEDNTVLGANRPEDDWEIFDFDEIEEFVPAVVFPSNVLPVGPTEPTDDLPD